MSKDKVVVSKEVTRKEVASNQLRKRPSQPSS